MTKHKPIYNLHVRYGPPGQEPQVLKISAPFTSWFDSEGYFVAAPFQQWLATEIPAVGEADPQKVHKGAEKTERENGENLPEAAVNGGATPPGARSRKSKNTR